MQISFCALRLLLRKMAPSKKVALGKSANIILPLLNVLRTIKPDQRQILFAHFDDKTRDQIYKVIGEVLKSQRVPVRERLSLKGKLKPFKKDLRYLTESKRSKVQKRKRLSEIGGKPMNHILKTAIPLLLNLFPQ